MFGEPHQREVVRAYDSHWLICVDLGAVDLSVSGQILTQDRYALAVPCNAEGGITLPSEPARVIRFTPSYVEHFRARQVAEEAKKEEG